MALHGLIVREPYAELIVSGRKLWEIRRRRTRIRGPIVIISNGYALGIVEIKEVLGPFSVNELVKFERYHLAKTDYLKDYAEGRDLYIWVLNNAVKLSKPIKINVPKGARVWVKIDKEEAKKIINDPNVRRSNLLKTLLPLVD